MTKRISKFEFYIISDSTRATGGGLLVSLYLTARRQTDIYISGESIRGIVKPTGSFLESHNWLPMILAKEQ